MKLFLKEVPNRYVQENFKKLQKVINALEGGSGGNTKIINNNTVQKIPLDGSEPISGTLLPDTASTHEIGSDTLPLKSVYSDEVYVGGNSLYVDGKKAISVDGGTGRLTYSNDTNEDLEVKSKGTGKLYIDSEGDIVITSLGTVTINGNAVANYNFDRDLFDIPTQIVNGNQIVLTHIPITNTERVILNGLELTDGASYDYIRVNNIITFNSGVLTSDGLIKVDYAYN